VLEVDIKGFFDNVRHDLVMKALKHHDVPKWVTLYCERWLKAPMVTKSGTVTERTIGTPQGGVISPLLANLVLHYAIDVWMQKTQPTSPFARYADDLVCHCKSMREANALKRDLEGRLAGLGLELNREKSRVVYVDTFKRYSVPTQFTFLGYDFKLRTLKDPKGRLFRKAMPGAAMKAMKRMTETVRNWNVHRSTGEALDDLARRYNPTVRGWIEYYGKFWYRNFSYRLWSAIQSRLLKWTCNKFRVSEREAERKLQLVRREHPKLFAHWYLLRSSNP
jgi:RNA-directed DNA polymerase